MSGRIKPAAGQSSDVLNAAVGSADPQIEHPAAAVPATGVTAFAIRGEYIQLDHLLKATGLVSSGGAAHAEVDQGRVRVDGKVESRKRAKLRPGQRVDYGGQSVLLVAVGAT